MLSGRDALVVRNFAPTNSRSRRSTLLSDEELLCRGHDLVNAVKSRDGWHHVSSSSDPASAPGRTFVLKKLPPRPSSFRADVRNEQLNTTVKEWGDISHDVLDVSTLKDFEGTDFSNLLRRKDTREHNSSSVTQIENQTRKGKRKRTIQDDNDEELRQKKRLAAGHATTPIYDLIPQPHHHSYLPSNHRSNVDITKRFPPYSKAPFLPIAPFSSEEVQCYFRDPFARSTWVIPVRGSLPWKEVTSAQLLDDSANPDVFAGKAPSTSCIKWTPFVINRFWSDLLEMRKQQALGAISLSYHPARAAKPHMRSHRTAKGGRALTDEVSDEPRVDMDSPETLEQCSFIKVFHDVRYAMYVRSVLDAWRTEVEIPQTTTTSSIASSSRAVTGAGSVLGQTKIKVRPLQKTILPLLNEEGQCIGVC